MLVLLRPGLPVRDACWLGGFSSGYAPSRTQQRCRPSSARRSSPTGRRPFAKVAGPFAKLSTPSGDWDTSPLRSRFINAGIRHEDARLIYFGVKTLLPLLFAGVVFVLLRAFSQTVRPDPAART